MKFECFIDAVPKPAVTWFINGKEVSNKDGVQIEKDVINSRYCLSIPKVNAVIHGGIISVKANNLIGSIQHESVLKIYGKLKPSISNFWLLLFFTIMLL